MRLGFNSNIGLINLFIVSKVLYIFFAVYVFSLFVRLGDTPKYLSADLRFELSSTAVMETLGYLFGHLPGPLAHIPLMLISLYGVVYLVDTLSRLGCLRSGKERFLLFFMLSLPSTGVWSSIHSKEAVAFLFVSVITAFLLKVVAQRVFFPSFLEFFCIFLCLLFKPQYMISFFGFYVFAVLFNVKFSVGMKCLMFISSIFIQLSLLAVFSSTIDILSFGMHSHFDTAEANSTRANIFFKPGDFFINAPYGIIVAFIGPLPSEAVTSPAKFFALIESLILVFSIFYALSSIFKRVLFGRLNVYYFVFIFITFFWILLVHYPFGVFNPGSAIRYRANFMPYFSGVLIYFLGKSHDYVHSTKGPMKFK